MFVCIWEQMEHLLISQIDPKYFQGTHWIPRLIKLFLGLFFLNMIHMHAFYLEHQSFIEYEACNLDVSLHMQFWKLLKIKTPKFQWW
jgi:hypothetical protein